MQLFPRLLLDVALRDDQRDQDEEGGNQHRRRADHEQGVAQQAFALAGLPGNRPDESHHPETPVSDAVREG